MTKLPIKKVGFYFSEIILATGAYIVLLWFFASKGYVFSSYNREISWLIVILFGIGILMVAYHLLNFYREESQLSTVRQRLKNFKSDVVRLVQNRHTLPAEMTSNNLRRTVDEHFAVLDPSLTKTRIYRLVNATLAIERPDQEMLLHLLEQQEEPRGNRVRYIAGILVMIGLLGTFLGLVQAVKYLQHFFTATESIDIATLFSDMKQTLGGLDKAFGTSIGGITAYLVLGYLNVVLRTKQSYILNQIEDLTLEELLPVLRGFYGEKSKDISVSAMEILRAIPTTLSHQLKEVLEHIIAQTVGETSEHLKATGAFLQQAAEGIQTGQETFTSTFRAFGGFISSFQESREQLLGSQEAITSGLKEFSLALGKLEENQNLIGSSLELTKNYIEHSETRLSQFDQIVQHIHGIWTDNRQVFEKIAEKIEQEHGLLVDATQQLQVFLAHTNTGVQDYVRSAQKDLTSLANEHTQVSEKLLESHLLLTTLVHDLKNFILDEQNGLRLLATSLDETFGETRFQYHQLSEHLEAVFKRIHDSQEQLAQLHETVTTVHQQLQSRRTS
ncbi:hypothetical protein U27_04193 [Candidatus Vecturithrix granuli]|uniref:MotA/TolQ/ExbB proton channel domain-containing protein n=1 Tax=Vecturithrix granuli TaxID=1499967 RepID=A0A081BY23_VECG1|nr:hypothetical protein U27_04193 [Candidatus Vecturithrix granuli]